MRGLTANYTVDGQAAVVALQASLVQFRGQKGALNQRMIDSVTTAICGSVKLLPPFSPQVLKQTVETDS